MPKDMDFSAPPQGWDRSGLPGWAYFNEELLELEIEELFRKRWQLACHVNDIPNPGDYTTFDVATERAIILRDQNGVLRAFHNLCRHRGSRVVGDKQGNCPAALVCPYHGWSYNLDGTLRAPAKPRSFPPLDPVAWGLKPVEMEIWQGFVFIRFKPSAQPPMSQILARYEAEVAAYRIAELVPTESVKWTGETAVNWKSVRDVDNEGYHVPKAHPTLQDLYGKGYRDEPFRDGAARSFAPFNEEPARFWSVRAYRSILPEASWLPESNRKAWIYIGLFPNAVIGLYPDSVMFYQEVPDGVGRARLRGQVYRHKEESRAMRAARYLSGRIDGVTGAEDQELTIWSYEATQSSGYEGILLSDLEYGVKTYHDELRQVMPVLTLDQEPARGTLIERNAELLAEGVTA